MIVFISPTNVIRGERQPHSRSGRVTKTTTLAAGYVDHNIFIFRDFCNFNPIFCTKIT